MKDGVNRPTLLILEGNAIVSGMLEVLLSSEDWSIEAHTDGTAALKAITRGEAYDLILVSYVLPGLSGIDLVRQIRRDHRHLKTPIIMLTGSGGIEAEARAAGVNDVIHKPFDVDELIATIKRLVLTNHRESN